MDLTEKIRKLTEVSSGLGEVGLVIIEKEKNRQALAKKLVTALNQAGYGRSMDYLESLNLLEKSQPFYYLEESGSLNDLMLELIAEFKTGIVSLMDRKHKTGLRTIRFNPNKNSIILVLTREQIESSVQLFEYVGPKEAF